MKSSSNHQKSTSSCTLLLLPLTYPNGFGKRTGEVEIYPNQEYHKSFCKHFHCVLFHSTLELFFFFYFCGTLCVFFDFFSLYYGHWHIIQAKWENFSIQSTKKGTKWTVIPFFSLIHFDFSFLIWFLWRFFSVLSSPFYYYNSSRMLEEHWTLHPRQLFTSGDEDFYCVFVLSRSLTSSWSGKLSFWKLKACEGFSNLQRRVKSC